MDWSTEIDYYCERSGPGLWDEPLNASTNITFLIAAAVAVPVVRKITTDLSASRLPTLEDPDPDPPPLTVLQIIEFWYLPVGLVAIGACSFLFHTFANRLTMRLDIISVLLFVFVYLSLFLRHVAGWSRSAVRAWIIMLIFATAAAQGLYPSRISNFAPMAVSVALLGWIAWLLDHRAVARRLWIATALFILSLTASVNDNAFCDIWPFGIHFIWHILNSVVLALVVIALGQALDPLESHQPIDDN
ncbi:MAG: hypothetical protein CMJ49_10910 [Planctomycetaceae bacterium]|nr:hypothetical protein [Planctomycetaceae bacterium]